MKKVLNGWRGHHEMISFSSSFLQSIVQPWHWHQMLLRSIVLRLSLEIVGFQHEAKMNMWEMCPIFSSSTECFPVGNIWIICFDPLDFLFYELIICRRYSLLLLGSSIDDPLIFICRVSNWSSHLHFVVAFWWWTQFSSVMISCKPTVGVVWCLRILPWERLESCSHVHRPEVAAVTTSDGHDVKDIAAWNTHRKNNIAKIAGDIAELLLCTVDAAWHDWA